MRRLSKRQWRKLSNAERIELAGGPLDPYMAPTFAEEAERLKAAWRGLGRAILDALTGGTPRAW